MATQIFTISRVRPRIIGNFVDEQSLEGFRKTTIRRRKGFRYIYVGSITSRKRPEQLVYAIRLLTSRGHDVRLDIVGDGPLRERISSMVARYGLQDRIYFHGHIQDPYLLISDADVFVLPSSSEGLSRAALEALCLGIPCVLRDVDGNAEMLLNPLAGELFSSDTDLPDRMIKVAILGRARVERSCLLPHSMRQSTAAMQYLELIGTRHDNAS